ncbi:methyltransferase domain-containing protein [Drechmeria coniospora]|uniref:Methyltransferase domain-containing protein n=1 Tax=Drechmeria coniospora TaxID=98403 RepID=A0A151GT82_DRECN|nr:methyltransferase domain-containing protein [Drechmeria coniospora]KYK60315.1 methyltransferase domain-containing protein [Drechmeria coniospora]
MLAYAFPNDAQEQERLELQGVALKKLFGDRLFFAPLSEATPPRTILDVATGVGDWAIQMGDLFPNSEIIATDLSPIQPKQVPPNVCFYVEDSSDPWEYSQKFDYIHTRITFGCWSSFEKQIAQQAFDLLEPGGWFESQETDSTILCDDGTMRADGPFSTWFHKITAAGEQCDRPTILGSTLKEIYERVGFVDVQERIFKMPTNAWAKDEMINKLGLMWERNLLQGLSGFSYSLFNRTYGWSAAQIEVSRLMAA